MWQFLCQLQVVSEVCKYSVLIVWTLLHASLDFIKATSVSKVEYGCSKFQGPQNACLYHTLSYYYYCIICKELRLCKDP